MLIVALKKKAAVAATAAAEAGSGPVSMLN